MNWNFANQIAEYLMINLRETCIRIEPAGSLRRMKADVGDLELVCIPKPGAPRPEFGQKRIFTSHLDAALFRLECDGRLGRRIKDGEKYKQIVICTEAFGVQTPNPFVLDLFIVRPETWGVQFAIRTGPAEYSKKFVTPRSWGGWLPDHMKVADGLLWDAKKNLIIPTPEEGDFFQAIGLSLRDPYERKV